MNAVDVGFVYFHFNRRLAACHCQVHVTAYD